MRVQCTSQSPDLTAIRIEEHGPANCAIFTKRKIDWEAGKGFNGGSMRDSPNDPLKKYLRAIDIHTGRIAWELPQLGPGTTRGGVLATATGILFFCADGNEFAAIRLRNGQAAMAFPGEPFLARVADDLRFRWEAARCGGVRFEYSRLHAAGLSRLREGLGGDSAICHPAPGAQRLPLRLFQTPWRVTFAALSTGASYFLNTTS
jgi:hypothetical protein